MSLRLDWCSYKAAKYAVEKWHYSRSMPAGKLVKIGVWEREVFVGAIIFGRGANSNLGQSFGLEQVAVCELVRIALRHHETPVSRLGSIAIRLLRQQSPGLRLLLSYADPAEGHHGGIYQAMGWTYAGRSGGTHQALINGERLHKRTVYARYGMNDMARLGGQWVYPEQKHKYLYPLDKAMRAQIAPLAKPYPKHDSCDRGEIDNAPRTNGEPGGASPTRSLPDILTIEKDNG